MFLVWCSESVGIQRRSHKPRPRKIKAGLRPRLEHLEARTLLSFGAPTNFDVGTAPVAVAVGDFHGDGKLDLAVADNGSNQMTLLTNTGNGAFQNFGGTFAVGNKPTAVAVGDFGSPTSAMPDGIPDLVVLNSNVTAQGNTLGYFNLLIGDNHGGFTKFTGFNQNISGDFNVGRDPVSVAVGDFNHDGQLDVFVANYNRDTTHSFGALTEYVRRSDGGFDTALTFGATTFSLVYGTIGHPTSLVVADFNGDGFPDIAAAGKADSDTVQQGVTLLLSDPSLPAAFCCGNRTFSTALTPASLAAGDFNRDDKLDLVVAFTSGDIVVFSGRGDGTFENGVFYGPIAAPTSIAVGYLNGDGVQDLVVTGSAGLSLLLGNPDGTFQSPSTFGAGSNPVSLATGDFNRDGLLDVVTANQVSNNVSVLLNQWNTKATLGFSTQPSDVGESVTITATVVPDGPAPRTPSGSVTFHVGSFTSTVPLSNGNAQFTQDLVAGFYTVSVDYSGDTLFAPASPAASEFLPIEDPVPQLAALSTTSIPEGSGDLTLTITGANFVTSSRVGVNFLTVATTFVDSSHLTAIIPAARLAAEGTLSVVVSNPSPGGGLSIPRTLTVTDAPLTAASVAIAVPQGVIASNVPVATFTDAGGSEPVANYTAMIDWGDGTTASAGTIALAGTTFTVAGSHTFVAPGRYAPHVTILDKGGSTITTNPATPNAIIGDANQRFVSQAYRDVLQRPVDKPGLDFWAGLLDAGTIQRVQFTQTLVSSIEYRVLQIEPLYQNFLHRTIDAPGLKFWSDAIATGLPLEGVKSFIFGSDEYFKLHGSDNDSYLKAVYQDLFGRTIDTGGEQFWLGQMQHGLTRVNLANAFVRFPEAEDTLVKGYFAQYLHHPPDAAGLSAFSTALQKGTLRDEDVVKALVATDEYFARV